MSGHTRNVRSPDEWHDLAQSVADRVTKGPGSTHARVLWVKDLLQQISTQYYEQGKAEAAKSEPTESVSAPKEPGLGLGPSTDPNDHDAGGYRQ